MRHIIVLSLTFLTACGSGGGSTQNAQGSSPATAGKHYLLVTDSPMSDLGNYLTSSGISITAKHADGYVTASTVDGTVLDGANSHIAGWLAEAQYDGIIMALGGQETLHDQGQFAHYAEARFSGFLNQLNYSGSIIIVTTPQTHSGAFAYNNRRALGITVIDVGSYLTLPATLADTYTPNDQGFRTITAELVTYL